MVKLWQKERSKPHPDLTIGAHMEEETDRSIQESGQ